MIFEDKLIIENALSLWLVCVLHKPSLLNDFYSFKQGEDLTADQFILTGLLLCPIPKIREEFKQNLGMLCRKVTDKA